MSNENENQVPGTKLKWHAPVLVEDLIGVVTGNRFGIGIDNYERSNPVEYGS